MHTVIFDLYGTLVDIHTDEDSPSFWKKLAKKTRRFFSYDSLELKKKYQMLCKEKAMKREEIEILDVFEELYQVDKKQAKEIAWIFRKCSIQYLRLYPGVKKLLKNLKKEGYQIRLLSNAQEAFTISELEKLKIKAYFDGIAISSMYGIKKPNQSFYKQALSDVDFSEAIMIGNEPECDIIPAQALGLKTIYIESNLTFKKNINPDVYGFDYKLIYQKIKKY